MNVWIQQDCERKYTDQCQKVMLLAFYARFLLSTLTLDQVINSSLLLYMYSILLQRPIMYIIIDYVVYLLLTEQNAGNCQCNESQRSQQVSVHPTV